MGGHEHGPPYKVPDHTIFQVKGVPQLEELEKVLAEKGLKDPWIRNEAWRYHPGFGTYWTRGRKFFFRGFGLGCVLTAITVGADKLLGLSDHGHGHDDHGHGHEGGGH